MRLFQLTYTSGFTRPHHAGLWLRSDSAGLAHSQLGCRSSEPSKAGQRITKKKKKKGVKPANRKRQLSAHGGANPVSEPACTPPLSRTEKEKKKRNKPKLGSRVNQPLFVFVAGKQLVTFDPKTHGNRRCRKLDRSTKGRTNSTTFVSLVRDKREGHRIAAARNHRPRRPTKRGSIKQTHRGGKEVHQGHPQDLVDVLSEGGPHHTVAHAHHQHQGQG